jgi:hypothetical protein
MNAVAVPPPRVPASSGGRVLDLVQRRLERALRERVRYRYVRPRVLREGAGYRIESPCCSRNVDPDGGVIDIALLVPASEDAQPAQAAWQLYARDHAAQAWVAQGGSATLDELMDVLCVDHERRFWP